MSSTTIRTLGALVATGGVLWGLSWILSPSREGANSQVEIWASAVFQLGLLALLAVMWVTRATGTGRAARGLLAAETVAVVLALAWTVPYLVDANRPTTGLLVVLDAFWPLSMAGLIVVGIVVVVARQWPSPLRWLPLAAALLIPVDIAVAASGASDQVRDLVMGLYLAASYGALGLALVRSATALAGEQMPSRATERSGVR
ncbi:hypothetical protein [Ornithinimicrobium cerasi]|uniref:Uncharacterized protein n=1 Tax=Ornithinimicrobium cerasi TaxID=2248773 RepID=A0A285VH46_9MICO|nr:hypothetical protein [Ornithinimicrobium cerasi]SOC51861.1 hypothetical protein SAMN05421879_101334 [Ornithinimicrobium cerasi]